MTNKSAVLIVDTDAGGGAREALADASFQVAESPQMEAVLTRSARPVGIDVKTLSNKINSYGIEI